MPVEFCNFCKLKESILSWRPSNTQTPPPPQLLVLRYMYCIPFKLFSCGELLKISWKHNSRDANFLYRIHVFTWSLAWFKDLTHTLQSALSSIFSFNPKHYLKISSPITLYLQQIQFLLSNSWIWNSPSCSPKQLGHGVQGKNWCFTVPTFFALAFCNFILNMIYPVPCTPRK